MMKPKKLTPSQILKNRIKYLDDTNFQLQQQIALLTRELSFMSELHKATIATRISLRGVLEALTQKIK